MLSSLVCLVMLSTVKVSSQQISQNGWKPVTFDEVYRQIRRDSQFDLNAQTQRQIWRPADRDDVNNIHSVKFGAVKVIEPIWKEDFTGYNTRLKYDDVKDVEVAAKQPYQHAKDCNQDCAEKKGDAKQMVEERTAKKLTYKTKPIINNYLKDREATESLRPIERAIIIDDDKIQSYEVTEQSTAAADIQAKQTKFFNIQGINIPRTEFKPQNNISENLTKILSKYGIKSDDPLSNYKLSRARFGNNLKNHNFSPNFNLDRFQKNIPKNLAVLLSTYGVYLPAMYGIAANYKNLYGNLALNNIHNNKPFGPYKILSDNDFSSLDVLN